MRNTLILIVIAALIGAGVYTARTLKSKAPLKNAEAAESSGNNAEALTNYCKALEKLLPSKALPDFNRSRVLPPASWKKEMQEFAEWITKPGFERVEPAKRTSLLAAVQRTSAQVTPQNFLNTPVQKPLTLQQFSAIWDSVYFAPGVAPDPEHKAVQSFCFNKSVSLVRLRSQTTYTYTLTLVDTVTNRTTTWTLPPENGTIVPLAPGAYMLICQSSFQPRPRQIWRSSPTIIPFTVPPTPTLLDALIVTEVERKSEK